MEIRQLEWDTNFFGYNIGKVIVEDSLIDENLLLNNDYKLIYIFSNQPLSNDLVKKNNLFLADEKVDLMMDVTSLLFDKISNENFIELTELDNNLLDLAFQSGHFSRFKIDPNFKNNEFEKLYTKWIEQSIKHENAEKVIGFLLENKVVGFITIGFKNNMVDIGLIAVNEQNRNLRIGKKLLQYVFNFALEKSIKNISVTTQKQNQGAMKFYLQSGFSINHITYIYHLWK